MAASSLNEAINRAIRIGHEPVTDRLKREIMEYVDSEIKKLNYEQLLSGGAPPTAKALFDRLFHAIPAFKTE